MAIGDVFEVDATGEPAISYVDTGMFDTPTYGAVYIIEAERPAIVDTGIGTHYERILDAVQSRGIDPDELAEILVTHVHLDHAGGAGFIADACPAADVVVHESGARFLTDPDPIWAGTQEVVGTEIEYYTKPTPVPEQRLRTVSDGDEIDLGDVTLDVHYAPGHAFHQVVFHDSARDIVFTADAAGICLEATGEIVPTSPPPGFDLEQVIADARMIADLEPTRLCYAHFGDAPVDDRLTEYVEVISDWVDAIAEARQELPTDDAVVEYFVEEVNPYDGWIDRKARADTAMNVRGVLKYLDETDD